MTQKNLKKLREAKGLSRDQLAELAGIASTTIYRAEMENRWPVHPIVRKALEAALGVR